VVIDDDETLRQRSEAVLADIVAGRPGVVLGHAGAMCLASRQRAYHVRLDGPEQRRVQRAMGLEHLDEQRALRRQAETDRARSLFIRRLYRASWTDPRWYHLVIDSTVLTLESTAQLVVSAAQAFWDAQP
jgi:cytidylate kinase